MQNGIWKVLLCISQAAQKQICIVLRFCFSFLLASISTGLFTENVLHRIPLAFKAFLAKQFRPIKKSALDLLSPVLDSFFMADPRDFYFPYKTLLGIA